jgi:DNA-binding HxlR family transcriptional regulator
MAHAAQLLGDRWSLLILREAFYGVTRFDDLMTDLAVSSATLTSRLRALVENDLLIAKPYRDANARTRQEYTLTEKGQALAPVLLMMMTWADQNLQKQASPLAILTRDTGEPVQLVLMTSTGRTVDWDNVMPQVTTSNK